MVFFEQRGPSQSRSTACKIRCKMARSSVSQRSTSQATTSRRRRLPSHSSSPLKALVDAVDTLRPSPAPRPAASFSESDERSSLLTPGPINNTSILRDMREPEIHTSAPVLSSSSCLDCRFVDCEDQDCLAVLEPSLQLCSDAESCPLTSRHFHDTCIDAVCEMEGCDGGEACDGNFEEFVSCQPSPIVPDSVLTVL